MSKRRKLEVDWARCTGRLMCAELLPELIGVDDWGYPVLPRRPVPDHLLGHARQARAACPVMALRLREVAGEHRDRVSRGPDG
jgi:ferredoxin